MNQDIDAFIEHARGKGMDHATIRLLLVSSGWKEKDVLQAMAKTSLDLPIPAPPDGGGAREAFFQLLSSAFFYGSLIAVIVVFFTGIDRALPDPGTSNDYGHWQDRWELSSIRWSLAWMLVSFPLFLWLSRLLHKEMIARPERAWSGIRRGLTYLTLLLASLAIAIDLVTLLYNLLEGELSQRFVLKVAAVLVLAGMTFTYYMISLRLPVAAPVARKTRRAFLTAAIVTVGAAVIWGFAMTGSPVSERERRIDENRVRDLEQIHDAVEEYCLASTRRAWNEKRAMQRPLPERLVDMLPHLKNRLPDLVDPETGEDYLYERTGATSFRIGATFSGQREDRNDPLWNHTAGLVWFEFDLLAD